MSETNEKLNLVAKTIFGLEETLASELRYLGAENIELHNRAVSFTGSLELVYRCNLHLRTALRILIPVARFTVINEHQFYEEVKKIDWEAYIGPDDTLGIDCVLNTPLFNHSQYISQKAKDAIVDQFREKHGRRPNVDLDRPVLRLHIHIFGEQCTIALDSSGESLHKRGYRDKTNLAPLNEVLAAGLILLSGWNKTSNFIDPMCGSGTLLIEAALMAANIPAGYLNTDFGFMRWRRYLPFDEELWKKIIQDAISRISTAPVRHIYGGELSHHVARKAKENVKRARVDGWVHVRECDMIDFEAPDGGGAVIVNPPYGERMSQDDIPVLYKKIGDTFKQRFSGYDCFLLTSNLPALKNVGLKASRRIPIYNGQLECRFVKYEMYSGTRRTSFKVVE